MSITIERINFKKVQKYDQQLDSLIEKTDDKDIKKTFTNLKIDGKRINAIINEDMFIATFEDDTILGYALGAYITKPQLYRTEHIFVSKDKRKQGIGFALLEAQITYAKAIGAKELTTIIGIGSTAEKKLYEKAEAKFSKGPLCVYIIGIKLKK